MTEREEAQSSKLDVRDDGETWEDYAKRLEKIVASQRVNLRALSELRDGPQRTHRKHIARLERLLGQKEAQLANQHEGLRALEERLVLASSAPRSGASSSAAVTGEDPLVSARLRVVWVAHLIRTAVRLEARAYRLNKRAEDCRAYADRHLRKLERSGVSS